MPETTGHSDEREADPGFLILVSLADGPKHGYAMIEDIEHFTGVRLSSGTLYGAVGRLVKRGLIEPLASTDRRQPYRLTRAGAEIARTRFRRLAEAATARLFGGDALPTSLPLLERPGEAAVDEPVARASSPAPRSGVSRDC